MCVVKNSYSCDLGLCCTRRIFSGPRINSCMIRLPCARWSRRKRNTHGSRKESLMASRAVQYDSEEWTYKQDVLPMTSMCNQYSRLVYTDMLKHRWCVWFDIAAEKTCEHVSICVHWRTYDWTIENRFKPVDKLMSMCRVKFQNRSWIIVSTLVHCTCGKTEIAVGFVTT